MCRGCRKYGGFHSGWRVTLVNWHPFGVPGWPPGHWGHVGSLQARAMPHAQQESAEECGCVWTHPGDAANYPKDQDPQNLQRAVPLGAKQKAWTTSCCRFLPGFSSTTHKHDHGLRSIWWLFTPLELPGLQATVETEMVLKNPLQSSPAFQRLLSAHVA